MRRNPSDIGEKSSLVLICGIPFKTHKIVHISCKATVYLFVGLHYIFKEFQSAAIGKKIKIELGPKTYRLSIFLSKKIFVLDIHCDCRHII